MEDYYKIPEFKVTFKSNISLPSYENFYLLLEECEAVSRGFDMGSIKSLIKKKLKVLVKIGYCFFKWIQLNLMINVWRLWIHLFLDKKRRFKK